MKISHVSELTKLSAHTIRYYEKINLIPKPKNDSSGHRNYSAKDVELINWISCLKHSGMSLNKIKHFVMVSQTKNQRENLLILEEHLIKLNAQLIDIKHFISVTKKKIRDLK